jgi:hypothetical protein
VAESKKAATAVVSVAEVASLKATTEEAAAAVDGMKCNTLVVMSDMVEAETTTTEAVEDMARIVMT